MAYKRIVLKISGEALSSDNANIDFDIVESVAEEIKELHETGVEVCLVVGGGNIWRGRSSGEMDRSTADQMGMLATVINSLALQDTLIRMGINARVMSALDMPRIAEPFIRRNADEYLKNGAVVIFACGTGNPYFSTDMTAALRAAEMNADVIMMAKNIDAVYDSDPKKNPNAVKLDKISYKEIISQDIKVMDSPAVTLCMENNIPICVFGLAEEHGIMRVLNGEKLGTIITD